jgi:hypothetical protein
LADFQLLRQLKMEDAGLTESQILAPKIKIIVSGKTLVWVSSERPLMTLWNCETEMPVKEIAIPEAETALSPNARIVACVINSFMVKSDNNRVSI